MKLRLFGIFLLTVTAVFVLSSCFGEPAENDNAETKCNHVEVTDAASHKGSGRNSSLACDIEISNVTVNGELISKNNKSGATVGGIAGNRQLVHTGTSPFIPPKLPAGRQRWSANLECPPAATRSRP